jgi:LacI family transcriptional regulator
MASPPRLKEIAASLGLSVPTVSLALRNAGNISRKTCARVQRAAESMGYRPNLYAAALSTGWHSKDAHDMPLAVIRWASKQGALYPVEPIVQGIERRGALLGYHVERCNLSSPRELPQCLRLLYNQGIQGIFLAPLGDIRYAFGFDWSKFCVLSCGQYDFETPFHTVRPEIFESTRALILTAAQRGYRRIGAALFQHDPPMIDDFARMAALRCQVISARELTPLASVFLCQPEDNDLPARWIRENDLDAAILFSVGQYHSLTAQKIRIPEDLGVVTLHARDDLYSRHISGMLQQDVEIGTAAVNHMDYMIRHHERGIPQVPQHIVIGTKWVEGTTLPDKHLAKVERRKSRSSAVTVD